MCSFQFCFFSLLQQGFKGFQIPQGHHNDKVKFSYQDVDYELNHGSVVIAAITSCTNTSNPSVMLGAGEFHGPVFIGANHNVLGVKL